MLHGTYPPVINVSDQDHVVAKGNILVQSKLLMYGRLSTVQELKISVTDAIGGVQRQDDTQRQGSDELRGPLDFTTIETAGMSVRSVSVFVGSR
jgi:hypothetical protein